MKKVLISLAAATIMVAGFVTSADAQRGRGGGAGFSRGGGGGFVGVRGGGGGRFVAGGGVRRAGFVGGPGFRRAGWVGGPGLRRRPALGRRPRLGGRRPLGRRPLVGRAPLCPRRFCWRWISGRGRYWGGYGTAAAGSGRWSARPGDRSGGWSTFAGLPSATAGVVAGADTAPASGECETRRDLRRRSPCISTRRALLGGFFECHKPAVP